MTAKRWFAPLTLLAVAALVAPAAGPSWAAKAAVVEATPFWSSKPDAAAFAKLNAARIARAKASAEKMLKVQGARTIENTLMAYDESSRALDEAGSQASLIENVHPDSAMRATAEKVSQEVAAYASERSLDRRVYEALAALDLKGADDETRFYVERELRQFRLAGVDKDDATRARIKALRDELVKIGQEFQRNIREDVRTIQVTAAELQGVPADYLESHPPGPDGKITLTINYPDYAPVMTYATSDAVRRRFYMEYQNRAHPKNVEVLHRLLAKRHELANLCGYPNWADYITADKMSGSARTVRDFIDKIVAASEASQRRDYQILLARKQRDVPGASKVEFWEQGYWSEKVKAAEYEFDSQAMRPYLPYEQVEQGVLEVASTLFGVTFRRRTDVPVWHPSVKCYELFEGDKRIGRFYLDMHPRPDKYNHAAQFDIRSGVAGRALPEAALVCNLPGGKEGDPGLCSIEDVSTVFHEFGHLLHTLFAGHRRWLGTAGIRTEHDFVEAPSQMLEEWMRDPRTLQTFARHHKTGEPVPTDLVMKMRKAQDFAKGLQVRRQMVYADLSLSLYDRDPAQVDLAAQMKDLVKRYQPFDYVDGTHFYTAFGHLDGYSAVYYTYMWSLVIAKDMFSAFDRGNLLASGPAMKYRRAVLEAGGSAPAARLVESFLGRPYGFSAYEEWLNEGPEGKTSMK